MVLFSLIGMTFTDQLLHLYALNVSQEKLVLMAALTRILFLQTIFLGMGVIIACFLHILGGERLKPIQRVLIRLRLAWV